jgi:hypothetical protein
MKAFRPNFSPGRGAWLAMTAVVTALATAPLESSHAREAAAQLEVRRCNGPNMPFCDAQMPVPQQWRGVTFHLSQNYPTSLRPDAEPWRAFDPKVHSSDYLRAALGYFFEGQIDRNYELSFNPANNHVRTWYHAPWQDAGVNGREFVHGLTRERTSEAFELHPLQSHVWHNYAVGLYNPTGAFTIGRVWADHLSPDPSQAIFPEGTVAAKLLFTTAPVSEVPYLRGAPEWTAYVYANPNAIKPHPLIGDPRVLMKLRLLQIDIAVKDARAQSTTGWVFGTFIYGGGLKMRPGSGWSNVFPVGIMWGNDPGREGSDQLTESRLNPDVLVPHYGWNGRLNGPVDNKLSACLSCHSTAEDPPPPMIPTVGADPALWFRNLKSSESFDGRGPSLDYSLALSTGISNFKQAKRAATMSPRPAAAAFYNQLKLADPRPPRDGGLTH